MALDIKQLIEDKSGDREYFAMVPGLLWPDIKLCSGSSIIEPLPIHIQEIGIELNVYDKWLYASLKKICGEKDGQCFLSTRGLAKFASMSVGQTSKSKAKLAEVGLIKIVCKKRSVKGQAIDHITVVDIWEENIKLMKARKEGVHLVNALKTRQKRSPEKEECSQDEHQPTERSQGEDKCSPHEIEEEPIEEKPRNEEEKEEEPDFSPSPKTPTGKERTDGDESCESGHQSKPAGGPKILDGQNPQDSSGEILHAGSSDGPALLRGDSGGDSEGGDEAPCPLRMDLHRATAAARAEAGGNYAVPPAGGGDDPLAECALSYFCAMQHEVPNEAERRNMLLEFSETLKPLKPTAEEVETAFEIMAEDFKYRVGNYNPFQDSFKRDLATCIRRARAEIDERAAATSARRARTEALNAEAQAALEKRRAARSPPVEGDWAWEAVKRELQLQMTKATFETWVTHTVGLGREDGAYTVACANELTRDWLDNRLKTTAERTLVGILGEAAEVKFEVEP